MPIRKRPNGSWLVDLRVDKARYRKTFPRKYTKREVAAFEREWRRQLERPEQRYATTPLKELLERYWQEHGRLLRWAKDVDRYLGLWAAELGLDTPALEITSDHISAVIGRWRGKVSDSSINRRVAVLRACWRRAQRVWNIPLAMVSWELLHLYEPEAEDHSVGTADRWTLLDAWPPRSRHMALLALHTGLRRGAIASLERKSFDFSKGVISVRTKGRAGGKLVTVPITQAVLAVLSEVGRIPDEGPIWPLTVTQVSVDIRKAREAAGLPGFRGLHDLRHSFAQDLEDAGAGEIISDALHHTSPALKRRYAKARTDRMRQVIEGAQRR